MIIIVVTETRLTLSGRWARCRFAAGRAIKVRGRAIQVRGGVIKVRCRTDVCDIQLGSSELRRSVHRASCMTFFWPDILKDNCIRKFWLASDLHLTRVWLASDSRPTRVWLASDSRLTRVWLASDLHLTRVWLASDSRPTRVWLASDSRLTRVWLASDLHLTRVWLASDLQVKSRGHPSPLQTSSCRFSPSWERTKRPPSVRSNVRPFALWIKDVSSRITNCSHFLQSVKTPITKAKSQSWFISAWHLPNCHELSRLPSGRGGGKCRREVNNYRR